MSDNTELDTQDTAMLEAVEAMTADAQLAATKDPDGWVVEWFMRKLVEFRAAKEAIQEHVQLLLNQIDAQVKALDWKWGPTFRQESEKILKAQKKGKSFLTPFGRIGHRSQGGKPTLVIDDEAKVIEQAEIVCPGAVKKSLLKTPLQEYAETTGQALEGTHIETPEKHDVFFAGKHTFGQPSFEQPHAPLLEGNNNAP